MVLRSRFRDFAPVIFFFVLLNAIFIGLRSTFQQWGVSEDVIFGGNFLIFALTFFSFLIAERGLQQKNPHAFVRAIYSSMLVKFFIAIVAAFAYIAINQKQINKPALFTCMGLYLVYSFLEVGLLQKMLRRRKAEKTPDE